MSKIFRILLLCLFLTTFCLGNRLAAQTDFLTDTVTAGIYDMGKMWTFDYPPSDYFTSTYHFIADDEWFRGVRMAALRFGRGCSASFVSENGLVMTNHHCARGTELSVQKPGENLTANGFFASKITDERKVDGLFVDQLVKIEDITSQIQAAVKADTTGASPAAIAQKEFEKIRADYGNRDEWKGLELQLITFYNGGKYSLYGFKRYRDVRLVFIPELPLGFFGGDYDNFTYPRYCLDVSFFRVYDDSGKPLKTKDYYKFNLQGVQDGEPVFVVGNPGSTLRLSTMADLKFRRDVYLPFQVSFLKSVSLILQEYNAKVRKDSIQNIIFGLENSYKALRGELDGLKDPYLMARKAAFEKKFREDVAARPDLASQLNVWDAIAADNEKLPSLFMTLNMMNPGPFLAGQYLSFANSVAQMKQYQKSGDRRAGMMKQRLVAFTNPSSPEVEERLLAFYLTSLKATLGTDDPLVQQALQNRTPAEAARWLLANTSLGSAVYRSQLLNDSLPETDAMDPLYAIAQMQADRYFSIVGDYQSVQDRLSSNRSKLGRMLFDLYGTRIPPDATFSLRINDGVVKGYEYNGTIAPYKTTFYGLYDRYYSFNGKEPWNLPERWKNPPQELLRTGLDFVTTNDIIGGNSGSPMINRNREVVGLVFDGNMESLPGRFIYVDEKNRAVGVNSLAIYNALKYIYKAKRLTNELSQGK
ncbi:MAG: S46 family peptidase [Bacteroidales bacterium]